jgi:hypothetical protein
MKRQIFVVIILGCLIGCAISAQAGGTAALRLDVEGSAKFVRVTVYDYNGLKMAGVKVFVSDNDDELLVTGQTDRDGVFSFPPPKFDDLMIRVIAADGRRAEYKLACTKKDAGVVTPEQQACLDAIAAACAKMERGKKKLGRAKMYLDAELEKEGRALYAEGENDLQATAKMSAFCAKKVADSCTSGQ